MARNRRDVVKGNNVRKLADHTTWMPAAVESLKDIYDPIGTDSIISFQFGSTAEEREAKLRVLTKNGFLHMGVERKPDGSFIRYIWTVRH